MYRSYIFIVLIVVIFSSINASCLAQELQSREGNIVVCIIELEHANAEDLVKTLRPFLSSKGTIVPYQRTNTLIIKDKEHIVNMLAKIIKGKPCTQDKPNAEK